MKKIVNYLFVIALLLSFIFIYAACGNNGSLPKSKNLPDFADCKIGYKLEVYPKVAFDYKMPDGTIVHIDSIEATLTAKNEIKEGDTIKEPFYPYEVTIEIKGATETNLSGKAIEIWVESKTFGIAGTNPSTTINNDGTFVATKVISIYSNAIINFHSCRVV